MPDIRVLIVDDHPIICKGIRDLLNPAVGITVAGEAHTGEEALQKIEELKPDVVLLDMKLPDMNGVDIIKKAYKMGSNARILGLSSYNDREFISQLLTYGASGYLLKDEVPEEIVQAVRGVAQGEVGWVSRKVAALLSQILLKEQEGGSDLTARELDVLNLVVEGKTNNQIGLALGISVKTVEKHLHAIFRKMGVVSRVEAAILAVQESLVKKELHLNTEERHQQN
ncbi:MAG TPA: response regulator transcription factor [Anaerolineales bacterium]|nr:response regulator transcription factor [Anaerolineales bacterium]